MAVLEAEKYNNVIDFGKKAITSLKENKDLKTSLF